jgi:hypothetical protein
MGSFVSAAVDLFIWIMGLFGFGKPDPVAQGEKLGKAETTESDALGELSDVQKASQARNDVGNTAADIMHDSANSGAAKPE